MVLSLLTLSNVKLRIWTFEEIQEGKTFRFCKPVLVFLFFFEMKWFVDPHSF